MKKVLFLLCCIGLFHAKYTYAQPGYGKLSGIITSLENQPLMGVNIRLNLQNDSSTIRMTISDKNGKFILDSLLDNTYLLLCSLVGFNQYASIPVTIDKNHHSIDLPLIVLTSEDVNIKEVVVTAKKPIIQHKIDRTILNIEAMSTAAGSNILEIISKSPGVMVDSDGDIKLNGKGNVLILIDDKPTYLSVQDLTSYLKSLPASMADRLELINNPPAKYDASNSAIINIVLKKHANAGFSGGLNLGFVKGRYFRSNDAVNMIYHSSKLNISSSLGFGKDQNFRKESAERYFYISNTSLQSKLSMNNMQQYVSNGLNFRTGADYYISNKTTVGFLLNGNIRPKTDNQVNSSIHIDDSLTLINTSETISEIKSKWKSTGINFNFLHKFDSTGTILTTDIDYIFYRSDGNQLLTTQNQFTDSSLNFSNTIRYELPSQINIYSVKADFIHPFNKKTRFDAGIKSSFVSTFNATDCFDQTGINFIPNYKNSNHFLYKENINAVYANLTKEWNRWELQFGLRMENTGSYGHLIGNAEIDDSVFRKNYTNFFPSIYILYKIDPTGNNIIHLNYNKRIRRPNYQQLNPFSLIVDSYTYSEGNPFLIPHLTHNLSLEYSYKNNFNVTLNYGYINRIIQTLTESSGETVTSKPENFGINYSYNLISFVSLNPSKKWNLQVSGILFYLVNKGNAFGQMIDNKIVTGELELINQFNLGRGWNVELSGFYASKHAGGQSIIEPLGRMDIGVQKKVLKDRGIIKIKLDDIFYTGIHHETIIGLPNQSIKRTTKSDTRAAGILFNYRFGNQSNSKKRTHSNGGAEDEKGRAY